MKLEELKKKLYKPGSEFEERVKRTDVLSLSQEKENIREEWQKTEKKKMNLGKKYLLVSASMIIAFFIIIVLIFWRGIDSFDQTQVKLEISGPERLVSGDKIIYTVKYKNQTKTTLRDPKLVFYYPEKSLPINSQDLIQDFDLSDLGPGQENRVELTVRIIGSKDEIKKARAKLNYQPTNISSRFENQAEFSSIIISVPLILDFDLPERLVSGQSFNFSLEYLNQAEIAFENTEIQLEYPAGFQFISANPLPTQRNNIWNIGDLAPKSQGRIFINGQLEGKEGEVKSFKARLGQLQNEQFVLYNETAEALTVSPTPLFISQSVNGFADYVAKAGETLRYQIDYENTTDIGIRGIVITSELKGSAIDLASLSLEKGSFDGNSQTITWKASNLSDLAFLGPHQKGKITFSVNIKRTLPIFSYNDKNFVIINTAKINSDEAPLSLLNIQIGSQSELRTKIASQLTLMAKGYFRDDLIPNSGPIPPKVGQTTTYTIKWQLSNTSNDLKDVQVKAYLPPHVKWMDRIEPKEANLKYQPQTGELTWSVFNLSAGTGLLLPIKQTAFQIAITPGIAHLGNLVELIGQSRSAGQDIFTGETLTSTDKPIDTNLPDDFTISSKDGRVIE